MARRSRYALRHVYLVSRLVKLTTDPSVGDIDHFDTQPDVRWSVTTAVSVGYTDHFEAQPDVRRCVHSLVIDKGGQGE